MTLSSHRKSRDGHIFFTQTNFLPQTINTSRRNFWVTVYHCDTKSLWITPLKANKTTSIDLLLGAFSIENAFSHTDLSVRKSQYFPSQRTALIWLYVTFFIRHTQSSPLRESFWHSGNCSKTTTEALKTMTEIDFQHCYKEWQNCLDRNLFPMDLFWRQKFLFRWILIKFF